MTPYRISGLEPKMFDDYRLLDDAALARRGVQRVIADDDRGFPCRISLEDAVRGESVLLLTHLHHDVAGPYRASGPIFIRERCRARAVLEQRIPDAFLRRLLSLRGYNAQGHMHRAEVMEGTELESAIHAFFEDAAIEYLHVHNARPGCYAGRVNRISPSDRASPSQR